jgi:hypothetical protein
MALGGKSQSAERQQGIAFILVVDCISTNVNVQVNHTLEFRRPVIGDI